MTNDQRRGHRHAEILADAKHEEAAMLADSKVRARVGTQHQKHIRDDIAHGDALLGGQTSRLSDAHGAGDRVHTLAEQKIKVLEHLRKVADFAGLPIPVQQKLGRGKSWHKTSPDDVSLALHDAASALADAEVAKAMKTSPQFRHDLETGAKALTDLHLHHQALRKGNKSATLELESTLTALEADAALIRLAAEIEHPDDPKALTAFESIIAHHQVAHREKKPPTTP